MTFNSQLEKWEYHCDKTTAAPETVNIIDNIDPARVTHQFWVLVFMHSFFICQTHLNIPTVQVHPLMAAWLLIHRKYPDIIIILGIFHMPIWGGGHRHGLKKGDLLKMKLWREFGHLEYKIRSDFSLRVESAGDWSLRVCIVSLLKGCWLVILWPAFSLEIQAYQAASQSYHITTNASVCWRIRGLRRGTLHDSKDLLPLSQCQVPNTLSERFPRLCPERSELSAAAFELARWFLFFCCAKRKKCLWSFQALEFVFLESLFIDGIAIPFCR